MTRSRSYLRKDGKIYNEGSNGAAYSVYSLMTLHGGQFLMERISSDLLWVGDQAQEVWYYTTDSDGNFDNDTIIPNETAYLYIDQFASNLEDRTYDFVSFEDFAKQQGN